MSRLKPGAPVRTVTEVGIGDYVKVGSKWKPIVSNSAEGSKQAPRKWIIRTSDGSSYDMYRINRYAKAEDLE